MFISLQWVIFQMIAAYNGVLHPSILVMTQHNFTGLNALLQATSINTLNGHPIKGLLVFVHFQRQVIKIFYLNHILVFVAL